MLMAITYLIGEINMDANELKEKSLKLHENGGKLEIKSKVKIENQNDLSLAYTPGVA